MNRCNDCNKFVSLETDEPEEESVEVEGTGIQITMNITRSCAECGTEMKNASVEGTGEIPEEWLATHTGEGHGDFDAEIQSSEATETGGSRYSKNIINFEAEVLVTCKCSESTTVTVVGDGAAASEFDEV